MSDADKGIRQQVLAGLVLVAAVCLFLLWQGGYLMPRQVPVPEGNGFVVPEHHIPPEYFANAKPATPISESAMVTIVISQETYERFSPADKPGIVVVPVAYLDFTNNFTNTTALADLARGEVAPAGGRCGDDTDAGHHVRQVPCRCERGNNGIAGILVCPPV